MLARKDVLSHRRRRRRRVSICAVRSGDCLRHDDLINLAPLHCLQIGGRWRFGCSFIDAAGPDAKTIKLGPKRGDCPPRIPIEVASSDPNKLPPCAFEITLAGHILFAAVRPMPFIAVAFDRKTPLHPLHHQIDAIPMIGRVSDAHLGTYVQPFRDHEVKNIPLELRIEFMFGRFGDETARV